MPVAHVTSADHFMVNPLHVPMSLCIRILCHEDMQSCNRAITRETGQSNATLGTVCCQSLFHYPVETSVQHSMTATLPFSWTCFRTVSNSSLHSGISWKDLQIKESELTRITSEFIHESAGEVTAKDSPQVIIRDLDIRVNKIGSVISKRG